MPPDHVDRTIFNDCGENLVYDDVEAAVTSLVCQAVDLVAASEAWTRKAGKSKNGGLNALGRRSYKGGTLEKTGSKRQATQIFLCSHEGHEKS